MKTKTFFSIAFVLTSVTCFSQTYVTQIKAADTKKWGYANQKGEIIIAPQFERCDEFTGDGFAAVLDKKDKKFYFINLKGERVNAGLGVDGIEEGFNSGLAAVKTGDKWGYLDTNGKLAIPAKYDDETAFDAGYAVAKSGSKYVVVDAHGGESAVEGTGILDIKHFSEKLAPFRASGKKFGFINETGKVAIPAKFQSVGYFKNGLAWAKESDGKLGYVDPKGEWEIKPQFDAGKEFDSESGLARIKKDDKWGYVNRSGEITYVNDTDVWGDFSGGLCEGRKGGKKGFYNAKGQWVIEPQFEGVRDFKNGFAAAKMNELWGMIDKSGKWVIKPSFAGIKDMELVR